MHSADCTVGVWSLRIACIFASLEKISMDLTTGAPPMSLLPAAEASSLPPLAFHCVEFGADITGFVLHRITRST